MSGKGVSIIGRFVGAAIGGGGGFLALTLADFGLEVLIIAAIAGVLALFGFAFGPKIWEVLVQIF